MPFSSFFLMPLVELPSLNSTQQPPPRGPGKALPRVSARGRGSQQEIRVRDALGE